jgi:hypothetical protein
VEGTACWPAPEADRQHGTRAASETSGLSDGRDEDALVSFMQTLTDVGFMPRGSGSQLRDYEGRYRRRRHSSRCRQIVMQTRTAVWFGKAANGFCGGKIQAQARRDEIMASDYRSMIETMILGRARF